MYNEINIRQCKKGKESGYCNELKKYFTIAMTFLKVFLKNTNLVGKEGASQHTVKYKWVQSYYLYYYILIIEKKGSYGEIDREQQILDIGTRGMNSSIPTLIMKYHQC